MFAGNKLGRTLVLAPLTFIDALQTAKMPAGLQVKVRTSNPPDTGLVQMEEIGDSQMGPPLQLSKKERLQALVKNYRDAPVGSPNLSDLKEQIEQAYRPMLKSGKTFEKSKLFGCLREYDQERPFKTQTLPELEPLVPDNVKMHGAVSDDAANAWQDQQRNRSIYAPTGSTTDSSRFAPSANGKQHNGPFTIADNQSLFDMHDSGHREGSPGGGNHAANMEKGTDGNRLFTHSDPPPLFGFGSAPRNTTPAPVDPQVEGQESRNLQVKITDSPNADPQHLKCMPVTARAILPGEINPTQDLERDRMRAAKLVEARLPGCPDVQAGWDSNDGVILLEAASSPGNQEGLAIRWELLQHREMMWIKNKQVMRPVMLNHPVNRGGKEGYISAITQNEVTITYFGKDNDQTFSLQQWNAAAPKRSKLLGAFWFALRPKINARADFIQKTRSATHQAQTWMGQEYIIEVTYVAAAFGTKGVGTLMWDSFRAEMQRITGTDDSLVEPTQRAQRPVVMWADEGDTALKFWFSKGCREVPESAFTANPVYKDYDIPCDINNSRCYYLLGQSDHEDVLKGVAKEKNGDVYRWKSGDIVLAPDPQEGHHTWYLKAQVINAGKNSVKVRWTWPFKGTNTLKGAWAASVVPFASSLYDFQEFHDSTTWNDEAGYVWIKKTPKQPDNDLENHPSAETITPPAHDRAALVGLPNDPGSNTCWLNSAIQALFRVFRAPLLRDLQANLPKYLNKNVFLQALYDLLKKYESLGDRDVVDGTTMQAFRTAFQKRFQWFFHLELRCRSRLHT